MTCQRYDDLPLVRGEKDRWAILKNVIKETVREVV
jgi:hypothetical protein